MRWELAAILAAGLFAGASVYINLVEHPARVQCGMELAVIAFGPSYHRATIMQASLAVIGLIAPATSWQSGCGPARYEVFFAASSPGAPCSPAHPCCA